MELYPFAHGDVASPSRPQCANRNAHLTPGAIRD
jgi:hypothetical protein